MFRQVLIVAILVANCHTRPQQGESRSGDDEELSLAQQIIRTRIQQTKYRLGPGINRFANDLYSRVANKANGKNVVISPFSVHTALSMVYFGSPEDSLTHQEMTRLLGLPVEFYADYAYNYLRLLLRYTNLNPEFNTTVHFANKLYVADDFKLKPNFNEVLDIFFLTSSESIDFGRNEQAANRINDFVSKQTKGLIQDLLSPTTLSELTRLVIVNAIYFKASWLNPFKESMTTEANWKIPGTQQDNAFPPQREYMINTANVGLARVPELSSTVLELPYVDEDFRMLIVLPDEDVDVRDVDRRFGEGRVNLNRINARLTYEKTQFAIPKFTTSLSSSLSEVLSDMGAKSLFTPGVANLTDIAEDPKEELFVSEVAHEAKIIVNEEGSEAAAATAAIIGTRTVVRNPKKPRTFVADRPFMFIIQDSLLDDGVPLFVGRIVDPENELTLPEIVFSKSANREESSASEDTSEDNNQQQTSGALVQIGQRSQDLSGDSEDDSSEPLPDCDTVTGFLNPTDPESVRFPCVKKNQEESQDDVDIIES